MSMSSASMIAASAFFSDSSMLPLLPRPIFPSNPSPLPEALAIYRTMHSRSRLAC